MFLHLKGSLFYLFSAEMFIFLYKQGFLPTQGDHLFFPLEIPKFSESSFCCVQKNFFLHINPIKVGKKFFFVQKKTLFLNIFLEISKLCCGIGFST